MSAIDDFKSAFENGNLEEAIGHVVKNDTLDEKVIYEIAVLLFDNNIRPLSVVMLISNLLERTKNEARESAFKLLLMALRANNKDFGDEVLTSSFLRLLHQTIPILTKNFQEDVIILLHGWRNALPDEAKYKSLADLCKILKVEGYKFPTEELRLDLKFSPPTWTDSTKCEACSSTFSTLNRKHHCRCCGKTFCSKCSNHTLSLPQFYQSKPARVCSKCLEEQNLWKYKPGLYDITRLEKDKIFIKPKNNTKPTDIDDEENDPDLKKAIELSLQEAKREPSPKNKYEPVVPVYPQDSYKPPEYPKIESLPIISEKNIPQVHHQDIYPKLEMPEPKSCSDPAYENLEISMKNLREKISVASQDTKSAYSNQSLHTIFQATLATYNVFIASREAIHRDIEKYSKYNDILQKIKKARITLDESRKINALKMIEQRRESDALLRMQMEQKMHLMQQQQIELECYKQSIMEKRLRELTLEPDNSNQNYALPPQNQPNLNYYPQPMNMNQPFYEGFQPQIPVHPQSSNYQYPVRISQEQFQNIPSNQQQGVNQVIPSQTQPPQHPDIEELISFDPIPKNP